MTMTSDFAADSINNIDSTPFKLNAVFERT